VSDFAKMVNALIKPGSNILDQMTAEKINRLHMAVGISGESGELLDAVKREAFYNEPLDVANVIEELGDLEFYMEGLRQSLHISREYVLEENIKKLGVRYKVMTFTDAAAQFRADKQAV